jgi:hypothetical protein
MRYGTKHLKPFLSLLLAVGACAGSSNASAGVFDAASTERGANVPPIMFWCWERPQDARNLPAQAGVAVLAGTVRITGTRMSATPRLQPLETSAGTFHLPVVRIETRECTPEFLLSHCEEIAGLVVQTASRMRPGLLQIDFDARATEREFYRQLLQSIRKKIPAGSYISMTALASWCAGDCWLSDLDVDEFVPMFFSMGRGGASAVETIQSRHSVYPCRRSVALGFSPSEIEVAQRFASSGITKGRRIYLYSKSGWSQEKEQRCIKEVQQWQQIQ